MTSLRPSAPSSCADGPPQEHEPKPQPADQARHPEESRDARGVLRRVVRVRRALPWLSLCSGVAGALWMDRGPDRAPWIAAASLGLWGMLFLLQWLTRRTVAEGGELLGKQRSMKVARFASATAAQATVQLCLFFAFPFYYQASALPPHGDWGHMSFLAALALACGVSLWDPWTERMFSERWLAPWLPGAASFLALDVVLPGFGISTRASLWISAALATAASAVLVGLSAPPRRRVAETVRALLVLSTIPLALGMGAARLLPPAPLRLVQAAFGTEQVGKWIAEPLTALDVPPERLICATAIASPVGVHDRLYHVWQVDGQQVARMELEIVGGRKRGYRTRSWLRGFRPDSRGVYRCSVVTASGQHLGSRQIRLGAGHP